jgi:hypothetical protein
MNNASFNTLSSGTSSEVCLASSPLAKTIRHRRSYFELSMQHASELSGLSVEIWQELEDGTWIPEGYEDIKAVARGVEANITMISILALASREGLWKRHVN